jgi:exodeoxyribonuclease V gamma subunit
VCQSVEPDDFHMIRLHYANRLENLIAPLADAIAAEQRARPLDRVTIVIPSRVIEHFLQHRISEAIGIAANLEFPFLRKFLNGVIQKANPKVRVLDGAEIELALFESLRAGLRDHSADFHAPRSYVDRAGRTETERELMTFRLARQLARLFGEYSISRRSMLQTWLKRVDPKGQQLSETEKWQKRLWASTFDANGYLRSEWKNSSDHNWILLPDAFEAVSRSDLKAAPPPVVHVFHLAYAGSAYARMFSQLGNLIELNIYALNPCLDFWEDVEHLSRSDRESWSRRHSRIGNDLEQSTDPFKLDAFGDTPALRLWGRPGREYIRMLNELTECDFDAHFTHQNSSRASLLENLQEDILNREPDSEPDESRFQKDDGSIRFLAVPGIAREAEIVANEIWSLLERDTRALDLIRFHQIAVIVPDALYQDYVPHIESAFRRLHELPLNIVKGGLGGVSLVSEAIHLLLRLPLGSFSRDEMLGVLSHPAIRDENEELETDLASRWCEGLGIFFGADADDIGDTYIPRDTYHWDQGLRRLALGAFMGTDAEHDLRYYDAPDSIAYLPFEIRQDQTPAVSSFIKKARCLLSEATDIRSHRLTLAQWSKLLSDLIVAYVHVSDPADERIRERCIEAIESITSLDLKWEPVSYQVVHEMVVERIAEVESRLTQFTEDGIAVGSLSALAGIPFRAIFLLGLNESQFPERDRRDPMDLRLARRKVGDVTPTERDRYLFLEALLAARERICLSYVARDAKTGDRLEPSSVVRELQFILRRYVSNPSLESMTTEHPLSRYDIRYFSEARPDSPASHRLVSYDSEARRGATMESLRKDVARHCGGASLPGRDEPILEQLGRDVQEAMRPALRIAEFPRTPEPQIGSPAEISLPLFALRRYLECPLQGAAQYVLGMFADEPEDLEQWQDEPIAQSILDRTTLLREIFWKARGNPKLLASEYAKAMRISQLAGAAPAGPFAQAAERSDLEVMQQWIEQALEVDCGSLDQWQEVRVGRADEFVSAQRIVVELSIPLRAEPGADPGPMRIAKIHGSLGFFSAAGNTSLRMVLREEAKAKDFLGPFLSAIVLAAAGELNERRFDAIVIAARKGKSRSDIRRLPPLTAAQARNYLSDLASDLLFGKNHYFLPIETAEAVSKEITRGGGDDLLDAINDVRDNEFSRCSSDYGPIRNARRFEPPPLEKLKSIMERRFGLIAAIFERKKS